MTPRRLVAFALEMRGDELPLPAEQFRRSVRRAVASAGFSGRLSVAVVGDETMRRVNRDHHATDAPTDVLAFPLGGAGPDGFDAEVVVSLDTARREAAERGVSASSELLLYVVHGVLHLLGFDDHAPADRRRMRAAERKALRAAGVSRNLFP